MDKLILLPVLEERKEGARGEYERLREYALKLRAEAAATRKPVDVEYNGIGFRVAPKQCSRMGKDPVYHGVKLQSPFGNVELYEGQTWLELNGSHLLTRSAVDLVDQWKVWCESMGFRVHDFDVREVQLNVDCPGMSMTAFQEIKLGVSDYKPSGTQRSMSMWAEDGCTVYLNPPRKQEGRPGKRRQDESARLYGKFAEAKSKGEAYFQAWLSRFADQSFTDAVRAELILTGRHLSKHGLTLWSVLQPNLGKLAHQSITSTFCFTNAAGQVLPEWKEIQEAFGSVYHPQAEYIGARVKVHRPMGGKRLMDQGRGVFRTGAMRSGKLTYVRNDGQYLSTLIALFAEGLLDDYESGKVSFQDVVQYENGKALSEGRPIVAPAVQFEVEAVRKEVMGAVAAYQRKLWDECVDQAF